MSFGAGPSYQVSDDSSSPSSDESSQEDFALEIQCNQLILQQQTMAQQYYLTHSHNSSVWGGSICGHAHVNRGRQVGATLLKNDYFMGENPTYANKFRKRFRMNRELFLKVRSDLKAHSSFWKKSYDAARQPGFSSYQKMCASLQFLAYRIAADSFDQYFRIGESTLLDYAKQFCRDIVKVFGPKYLRKPNATDIEKLLQEAYRKNVERAFGVLQARFAIIRGAARLWNKRALHDVMSACIIMHNMIFETERSEYLNNYVFDESPLSTNIDYESSSSVPPAEVMRDVGNQDFLTFLGRHRDLMNQGEHNELRRRLVAHLWDHSIETNNDEGDNL